MTILRQILGAIGARRTPTTTRQPVLVPGAVTVDGNAGGTTLTVNPEVDDLLREFRALSATEQLRQVSEAIKELPPAQVVMLTQLVKGELDLPFIPYPGPQTNALISQADILLYGGAAGAGKSYLLIGTAAEQHSRALILRREGTELDGLISDSREMLSGRGTFNGSPDTREWTLKNGASIKFGGMKEPDDWRKYAGRARDFIGLDEGAEFLESQVRAILGWLRSTKPGQRTRMIIASNPPRGAQGEWVLRWFGPWLDPTFPNPADYGELRWAVMVGDNVRWVDGPDAVQIDGEEYTPRSHTFIPGKLDDNPALSQTGYRRNLQALPEPLRSQLLKGDFMAGREDDQWQVIPTEWVMAAVERWENLASLRGGDPNPPPGRKMTSVGVDVAMGGGDETVIAARYGSWFAMPKALSGFDTKDHQLVAAQVFSHMRDGCMAVVDLGGGWGGEVLKHLTGMNIAVEAFMGVNPSTGKALEGQAEFRNLRAETWWQFREALDPNGGAHIALPPDQKLIADLTSPRWHITKLGIQIETKDDIRKRLGRSPDRGDAVTMAWAYGGLHQQKRDESERLRLTANVGYASAKSAFGRSVAPKTNRGARSGGFR